MTCVVYTLGTVEYQQAWDLQNQLADQIAKGEHPPALLLLEHPHVYTFGRQSSADNLLWNETQLRDQGISTHWIDRGGDVTYHGPGQLVGYPILPLAEGQMTVDPETGTARMPKMDYVGYIRKLEKVLIKVLFQFGIAGGQIEGQTGVWVQPDVLSRCVHCPPEIKQAPAKIASIGVKVDARGISRHGFSLNIAPDMSYWKGIIACGLENQNKVSLAQLVQPVPEKNKIIESVIKDFATVFEYTVDIQTELKN